MLASTQNLISCATRKKFRKRQGTLILRRFMKQMMGLTVVPEMGVSKRKKVT
jgi:hypothetical protein